MKIVFEQDDKETLMDIQLSPNDVEDLLWGRIIEKELKIAGKTINMALYKREPQDQD